jgi:serine/threonine protein kinase
MAERGDNREPDAGSDAAPRSTRRPAPVPPEHSLGTLPSAAGETSLPPDEAIDRPAQSADSPAIPAEFGRYRILRVLGAGAMGTVYLAEDTQLKRQVALKIPQLGGRRDDSRLERFFREARLAATLSHPNICPIFDVGQHAGMHFISMAFVQGRPLAAHLKSGKAVSERSAASLVRKLALALHEAHRHGVVHRDLKPANIMIDQRGEPIVMDFGLARRTNATDESQLTQSGAILGTPAYMSPEQVRGETTAVGAPADIYALGVILYQILTGRLPFEGSVVSVLAQIATQSPAPPSKLRAGLSRELEAICLKAMARDPAERFADTAELAAVLADFLRKSRDSAPTRHSPDSIPITPLPASHAPETDAAPQPHVSTGARMNSEGRDPSPRKGRFRNLTPKAKVLAGSATVLVVLLAGIALTMRGNGKSPGAGDPGAAGGALATEPADVLLASAGSQEADSPTLGIAENAPEADDEQADSQLVSESSVAEEFAADELLDGQPPVEDMPPEEPEATEVAEGDSEESSESLVEDPTVDGAEAEDDSSSKKKQPARRAAVDPFPVGSRWSGRGRQWIRGDKAPIDSELTLSVLERDKGTFRIRYGNDKGTSVQVSGTIRKNSLHWATDNADVQGGTIGRVRVEGMISNGKRLEIKYVGQSADGRATRGVITMHLQQ